MAVIDSKEDFLALLNDTGETFGRVPYYVTSGSDIVCQSCARSECDLICEAIDAAHTHGRDQWDGHYNVTFSTLTNEDDEISGVMCDHCAGWIVEPELIDELEESDLL